MFTNVSRMFTFVDMSVKVQISNSEWKVLEVVWKSPPVTAQDVLDALGESQQWKMQTIKTLIGRLVKKGVLTFEQRGNRYYYTSILDRDAAVAQETESFIDRITQGSVAPLIAHLVQSKKKLSDSELQTLKDILNDDDND